MQEGPKARKRKPVRQKHVPQRTCIVCRQTTAKRELVRIVRTLEGQVEVDPTGKRPGRGAYICGAKPCWELGLKRRSLEHALQTTIAPENRDKLMEFATTLEGSAEPTTV